MLKKFHNILQVHVKDAVYAANDGVVTTFAVVAGFAGYSLHHADLGGPASEAAFIVLLVVGFASLFADGFSMATGNYLGTRSESSQYAHEKGKLKKEFQGGGEAAVKDAHSFLQEKGFSEKDADKIAGVMVRNKSFFYDIIISHRLGIGESSIKDALRGSVVTLISFLIAGIIPLIPYIVLQSDASSSSTQFLFACILTGVALFVVGAWSSTYSGRKWTSSGAEMLLVGGFAAGVAYSAGYVTSLIVL